MTDAVSTTKHNRPNMWLMSDLREIATSGARAVEAKALRTAGTATLHPQGTTWHSPGYAAPPRVAKSGVA